MCHTSQSLLLVPIGSYSTECQLGCQAERHARQPRDTVGEMRLEGREADLLALPVDTTGEEPMQDEDGRFYCVFGVSRFGGPDILGKRPRPTE